MFEISSSKSPILSNEDTSIVESISTIIFIGGASAMFFKLTDLIKPRNRRRRRRRLGIRSMYDFLRNVQLMDILPQMLFPPYISYTSRIWAKTLSEIDLFTNLYWAWAEPKVDNIPRLLQRAAHPELLRSAMRIGVSCIPLLLAYLIPPPPPEFEDNLEIIGVPVIVRENPEPPPDLDEEVEPHRRRGPQRFLYTITNED